MKKILKKISINSILKPQLNEIHKAFYKLSYIIDIRPSVLDVKIFENVESWFNGLEEGLQFNLVHFCTESLKRPTLFQMCFIIESKTVRYPSKDLKMKLQDAIMTTGRSDAYEILLKTMKLKKIQVEKVIRINRKEKNVCKCGKMPKDALLPTILNALAGAMEMTCGVLFLAGCVALAL